MRVLLSCARACPGAQCAHVRARNELKKTHKLKPALTTMDIHTIQATTDDGFSSPTFHRGPPPPGVDVQTWTRFLDEANVAVQFHWCPSCFLWAFCCFIPFCCNYHNKNIGPRMQSLCETWNQSSLLPVGVAIRYDMHTERVLVSSVGQPGQVGATLVTYHRLTFYKTA